MIEILVPEMGLAPESRILISCWLVDLGAEVIEGDRLVELLINEMTFDVPCPTDGRLARIDVGIDGPVRQGQVIGAIQPE